MDTKPQVRVVYYPAPNKVYSPQDLRDVFAKISVNDPIAEALRQIFQQRYADAALDASDLVMTERAAGHAAGRLQEIMDFRSELLGYFGAVETAAGTVEKSPRKPRGKPQA